MEQAQIIFTGREDGTVDVALKFQGSMKAGQKEIDPSIAGAMEWFEIISKANEGRYAPKEPAIIKRFWEIYEALEGRGCGVNHSSKEGLIAINFNHFLERSISFGQEPVDMGILKKVFEKSVTHKFIEKNKPIRSKISGRTLKCWVFEKQKEEE